MEMTLQNVAGVLLVIGQIVVVAITMRNWAKISFRALPFVYATAASVAWSWNRGDSPLQLLQAVVVMNAVAGFFVGIAWFEFKRKE